MLKDWMPRPAGEQNEQKARLKWSREELAALQMKLKENKLPVLVLVEGWGAAGKGSLIRSLIKELDPRFFQVVNMAHPRGAAVSLFEAVCTDHSRRGKDRISGFRLDGRGGAPAPAENH